MKNDDALNLEYIGQLRRAWQKRAGREQRAREERRCEAMLKAVEAAAHMKNKYGVKSVYLYGSLAWGNHFTHKSDIDLLVEGFPAGMDYWRMLVEVEEITSPVEVSVILGEDASPGLRKKAREEGNLL